MRKKVCTTPAVIEEDRRREAWDVRASCEAISRRADGKDWSTAGNKDSPRSISRLGPRTSLRGDGKDWSTVGNNDSPRSIGRLGPRTSLTTKPVVGIAGGDPRDYIPNLT